MVVKFAANDYRLSKNGVLFYETLLYFSSKDTYTVEDIFI